MNPLYLILAPLGASAISLVLGKNKSLQQALSILIRLELLLYFISLNPVGLKMENFRFRGLNHLESTFHSPLLS
jgi:hypothetical protein